MIKLRAKAKTLGIEGYKGMSSSELSEAVKKSEGKKGSTGTTAAKSASTNGRKRGSGAAVKSAVKKAASTVTKKATTKKSTGRKSASAKSAPAKAKRPTTGAKRGGSTAKKSTTTRSSSNGNAGRNVIDNSKIDWTAESNVGASEPRATIMKWLRKFKGDVEKVYNKLEGDVATLYKANKRTGEKYTQAKRKELLRWHISRVKFDFVMDSGQHEKSTNRTNASGSTARKSASTKTAKSAKSNDADLKELSDRQLQNVIRPYKGKPGAKPARVKAAIALLAKRTGGSTSAKKSAPAKKSGQASAKRQAARGGRKTASSRKRGS